MRSTVRSGKVKRIMITHVHGDHLFGLPGLVTGLCALRTAQSKADEQRREEQPPQRRKHHSAGGNNTDADTRLRIYGPRGVRQFLNHALLVSRMRLRKDFYVHELCEDREEALEYARASGLPLHDAHKEPLSDSIIAPSTDAQGKRTWNVCQGDDYFIEAGWLDHTVPCWGYVFTERRQLGKLVWEKVRETALGNLKPGPWVARLKMGEPIKAENGVLVTRDEVCEAPRAGRKLTILGDTCDSSPMHHLMADSTLQKR